MSQSAGGGHSGSVISGEVLAVLGVVAAAIYAVHFYGRQLGAQVHVRLLWLWAPLWLGLTIGEAVAIRVGLAAIALVCVWVSVLVSRRLLRRRRGAAEATSSGAPALCSVGGRAYHLSADVLRHNLWLLGPIGSGKTETAINLLLAQIALGHGGCYVDPKDGVAIRRIKERIPDDRLDDVILVDPSADRQVGINILEVLEGEDPEVVAREATDVFRDLLGEHGWGPRMDGVSKAALRTLMRYPGGNICDLIPLFTDEGFRSRAAAGVQDDPILTAFWKGFEEEDPGVEPVLARLMAMLMDPAILAIFGQPQSTVSLADVIDGRKILLLDIGGKGEDVLAFTGSFLIPRLWQMFQRRARLQPDEDSREDWLMVVDEFHLFVRRARKLEEIASMSRSLHWPLIFCNQYLWQLRDLVHALEANAKTRCVWDGPDVQEFLAEVTATRRRERSLHRQRENEVIRKVEQRITKARTKKRHWAVWSLTRRRDRLVWIRQNRDHAARQPVTLGRWQMAVKPMHGPVFVGSGLQRGPELREAAATTEHALQRWGRPRQDVLDELAERRAHPERKKVVVDERKDALLDFH